MIFITILVLTSWWYIPISTLLKDVTNFYFSSEIYGRIWLNAPIYYFKKLLPDLGIVPSFFFVIGLFYLTYITFYKKHLRWFLPVAAFLCVYVPGSFFIATKTPWLCLSATPALAMIAGGGALYLLKISKRIKILIPALCLLLLFTAFKGLTFSYADYHMTTYPNGWPGALASRDLALYLNRRMKKEDSLMISEFTYWQMPTCPIFLYYWKPHKLTIIKGNEKSENIVKKIADKKITWLVIVDSPDPKNNLHGSAKKMQGILKTKAQTVRWSHVWNVEDLWRK